jgi:aspartate/methionine/tyrosine aminotransferase
MRLIPRTLDVPTSPIADAHRWVGQRRLDLPLLDMSQAAPSYPTAPVIAEHIAAVAASDDGGRYAPPPGLPVLLEAFSRDLHRCYGADIDGGRILPTGGCNQAFCVVTSTLTQPGDEVILPVPYYFNHDMWLKLDGVVPRYLYRPDPEQARDLIGPRTRAIVLVTPGNPTGVTLEPDLIQRFYQLARDHDLALIVDETYRNFRTTTEPAHWLFDHADWDRTLVSLHSFSKDLAIPGYRVGAVVGSPELKHEVLKLVDCVQICAPRIGQEAAAVGLDGATDWRRDQVDRINNALTHFQSVMADEPGGFRLASAGAFFGWVRHPFGDAPVLDVIRRLIVEQAVVAIPGTAFTPDDQGWIRFSYANLSNDELDDFADRIGRLG